MYSKFSCKWHNHCDKNNFPAGSPNSAACSGVGIEHLGGKHVAMQYSFAAIFQLVYTSPFCVAVNVSKQRVMSSGSVSVTVSMSSEDRK
jgi:hypothetical protein